MKKSTLALSLFLTLSPLAAFAATAPLDLVGPVSDYKIYVTEEIGELVTQTQAFTDAINKGDLATAKKLYASTRVHYESIEPIAELFSDLCTFQAGLETHAPHEAPQFFTECRFRNARELDRFIFREVERIKAALFDALH